MKMRLQVPETQVKDLLDRSTSDAVQASLIMSSTIFEEDKSSVVA